MKSTSLLLAIFILGGMTVSLFLPFFESFNESIIHRPLSIISERPNPHQGGMFGGGYYTTYNGFGSIMALFNLGICLLIFILLLSSNWKLKLWRILLVFSILSHLLLYFEMIVEPYFLSPSDTFLIGYYLMLTLEISMMILAYRLIKPTNRNRDCYEDILDQK